MSTLKKKTPTAQNSGSGSVLTEALVPSTGAGAAVEVGQSNLQQQMEKMKSSSSSDVIVTDITGTSLQIYISRSHFFFLSELIGDGLRIETPIVSPHEKVDNDLETVTLYFRIQELLERNLTLENQLRDEIKGRQAVHSVNMELTIVNDSLVKGLTVVRVEAFELKLQIKCLENTVAKKESKISDLLKALEVSKASRKIFVTEAKTTAMCLAHLVSYSCFFVLDDKLTIYFSPRTETLMPGIIVHFVLKLQN